MRLSQQLRIMLDRDKERVRQGIVTDYSWIGLPECVVRIADALALLLALLRVLVIVRFKGEVVP